METMNSSWFLDDEPTSDDSSVEIRVKPVSASPLRLSNKCIVINHPTKRPLDPRRSSSMCPKKRRLSSVTPSSDGRTTERLSETENQPEDKPVIQSKKQRLLASRSWVESHQASPFPTPSPEPESSAVSPPTSTLTAKPHCLFRPWELEPKRVPLPSLIVPEQNEPLDLDVKLNLCSPAPSESSSCDTFSLSSDTTSRSKAKQRNYKSMTRERRIEANARERTRVHTISAAFENLRAVVPTHPTHKLSKLALLRIASAYILALSRLTGNDYSADGSEPSFEDCADACARLIESEAKASANKWQDCRKRNSSSD